MNARRLGTARLMGLSIFLLVLFITLAAVAYTSSNDVERSGELITADAVPGSIDAYAIKQAVSTSMGYTLLAGVSSDAEQKNSALQIAHAAEQDFQQSLDKYTGTILINPRKDDALVADLSAKWTNYRQLLAKYEDLIKTNDQSSSTAFLEQTLIPAFNATRNAADTLINYNDNNALSYARDIRNSVQGLRTTVIIVMSLALLCTAILAYIISIRRRDEVELIKSDEEILRLNAELEQRIADRTAQLALATRQTAFLEAQTDSSLDGILVVDNQNKKILQNQRMNAIFKIPPDIAAEPDDTRQVQFVAEQAANTQQFLEKVRYLYSHPDEVSHDELALKDGTVLDRYSSPVLGKDGKHYGRIWTFRDITERKRAELRLGAQLSVTRALAEAESLPKTMRKILEIICVTLRWELGSILTIDSTTKSLRCVEIWYPPSTKFHEHEDSIRKLTFTKGVGLQGAVWASRQPMWASDVEHNPVIANKALVARMGLRSGAAFPITLRDEVLGVMVFFSTEARETEAESMLLFSAISTQIGQFLERQKLESQFQQAQKMEAMGTLAGGIAHDFNNILAAMNGYTELAQMSSRDNPKVTEYLETVLGAGKRARELVKQILTFSRQEKVTRQPVQLHHIVAESFKLLRATVPATIEFKTNLVANTPMVLADTSQVHQVLMNLGTNAWHAMKDRTGCLEVKLETCNVDAHMVEMQPRLRQGLYARISVSDSGSGMDRATLERIFEPFFTTKPPGEGTGLGLSVLYGIMQGHEGVVTVYSEPGVGTTFHLYFPAHEGEAVVSSKDRATPKGNNQRILYLDDEEILTRLAKNTLEILGYKVDTHTNSLEVLKMIRDDPTRFDLVITDYTMPGMTGTDLAKQLLLIRPNLPIILTTGYAATLTPEYIRSIGIREFLLKPHTLDSLAMAVHRALSPQ